MNHAVRLRRAFYSALRPPPRLSLADWAESNLRLPDELAASPGPIRLYPFQRGIADAMSDPDIERVSVVKSARVGYTTLLVALLGHHVVNEPAPVLFVLPTEDDARQFMVSNVEPTFAASPVLVGALSCDRRSKSRNTMLSRRFPGGSLKVVAAKSPRNLRAHNTRILVVDEADGMEVTAEGSPIALAEKRTLSFPDRKIVIGSTPSYEATSHVLKAYARSDKRVFEVPCPHCGEFHEIKWADIHWDAGDPSTAHWCCPGCGCVVEERQKADMVAQGRWRATAPEVKGHAGFRVNALVSPLNNASWAKLAEEWLVAKQDRSSLQTFVNTVLAEGWRDEPADFSRLHADGRAEPFGLDDIPEAVIALTAGVDVQEDRLETTIIGWSEKGEAFILGHRVLWGSYDSEQTWRDLDALLLTSWKHPYGGTLKVDAAAVDSGSGLHQKHVYAFTFPRYRQKRLVYAIKGASGNRPPIEKSRQRISGGNLWIVGVDGLKEHLFGRVTSGSGIRFSHDLPESWFEQLAGEQMVVRQYRGQPVLRFERISGARVEALDCTVYAFAVWKIIESRNWSQRKDDLHKENPTPVPVRRPRVIESAWMNR